MGRGDINANYPPQVPEGDLVGRGDINANYPPQVPEGDLVGRGDINANYPPQVPETAKEGVQRPPAEPLCTCTSGYCPDQAV